MILSGQTIRKLCNSSCMISPFSERREFSIEGKRFTGGLGPAGYDVAVEFDAKGEVDEELLYPGRFLLASTIERFEMPTDVVGMVCDKSSWARRGVTVFNTIIEPGWRGWLTLEIKHLGNDTIVLKRGTPIAQIVFMRTDEPVLEPYGSGLTSTNKYQDQGRGPKGPK